MDTPCSTAARCSDDEVGTPDHDQTPDHTEFDPHAEDWYRDPGSGRKTPDGRRRRRALERCWNECGARLRCLDIALSQPVDQQHGIWGGYTEDQRVQILTERDRRAARAAAVESGEAHHQHCLNVASIAGVTPEEVHEVGGVAACRVNSSPDSVAATA